MDSDTNTIAGALCDVIEKALIEKGIAPGLARQLATKACVPTLQSAPGIAKKAARKVRKGAKAANRKLSMAFKEANQRLRKKNGDLKKGKTQSDVARLAQRLRKKMK